MRIIVVVTLAALGIVSVTAPVVAQQDQQGAARPAVVVSVSPTTVIETSVNTAVGFRALESNSGTQNAALGSYALFHNSSGAGNTASGYVALYANTTGHSNTGSGSEALVSNTTGYGNTAVGWQALYSNTTGYRNVAVGRKAGHRNTTGSANIAVGDESLNSNQTGVENTGIGPRTLQFNVSGNRNTAIGYQAGYWNSGSYNIFLGANVLGATTDTNTMRLGLPYDGSVGQNRTFIAGIYGTALGGSAQMVYIDANGQLGTLPAPPSGGGYAPMSQVEQPIEQLEQQLRDQSVVIADLTAMVIDLRARLARVEATAKGGGR